MEKCRISVIFKNISNALNGEIKDFTTKGEEVYEKVIKMPEIAKYEVVKRAYENLENLNNFFK